jgi:glucose/arabinose dehydrogenase
MFCVTCAVLVVACSTTAKLPETAGMGPNPSLPDPDHETIPTIEIAPATGWPEGAKPVAAQGTSVAAFADGLDHPRWLYVLPNGDVLVAETNAPERPEQGKGIKGWFMKKAMAKAGAAVPSANRITLLRDTDGDGIADVRSEFLQGLNSPFGMTLVGNDFYVANTDALVRFPYTEGQTRITASATKVTDLPGGPLNHHWTKNVIASDDGSKLYVTVGSNSNVAEYGMEKEKERAAILEVDAKTGERRVFASGLRNPNGMAWHEGVLWTVVNERDELGGDLVPDYLTSVRDGAFYGWPYSYYGQHVDTRVEPQRPELVAKAIKPDYALGPHTASLGLTSAEGATLPANLREGMIIGQHGSWNRKPRSGYRVLFVPFSDGQPSGEAVEILTGFVDQDGRAQGRPVGVVIDKRGGLLVADDVGNTVWRVTDASATRVGTR